MTMHTYILKMLLQEQREAEEMSFSYCLSITRDLMLPALIHANNPHGKYAA